MLSSPLPLFFLKTCYTRKKRAVTNIYCLLTIMSLFNLLPHHYEAVLPSSLPIKTASKALTKPNLYCRCRRQLRTVRQQLWGREMSRWFHLPRNVSMAQFQLSAALLFPRGFHFPLHITGFTLLVPMTFQHLYYPTPTPPQM